MKNFAIGIAVFILMLACVGFVLCAGSGDTGTEKHISEYETIIIEGNEYPTSEVKSAIHVTGGYTIEMKDGTFYGVVSIILKDKKN